MQFDIDMKSKHKALFSSVRKVFLENFMLKETIKARITTYANDKGGICHMRTTKQGVDVGFLKGVHMEDKYGLLTGSGKVMRVLPMSELNIVHVEYYINQAIAINSEK